MKPQFFEPMIEEQETQMRGFQVGIGGTYVLLDDVVTALRQYAQSLDDPNAGALIHDVATWLHSGLQEDQSSFSEISAEDLVDLPPGGSEPPYGYEALDGSPDIDRVEIFPDPPEDPRPKWYARSIDTGGYILQTTGGSFDQEWVIQNAQERWPGKDIHLLKNAGEDSKWTEDGTRGVFPSKGPPVRRLWQNA